MLKVEQYFEDQKIKAVEKAVQEATEKAEKEAAKKMLLDGMELSQIVRYVKLPKKELEQLQKEL